MKILSVIPELFFTGSFITTILVSVKKSCRGKGSISRSAAIEKLQRFIKSLPLQYP